MCLWVCVSGAADTMDLWTRNCKHVFAHSEAEQIRCAHPANRNHCSLLSLPPGSRCRWLLRLFSNELWFDSLWVELERLQRRVLTVTDRPSQIPVVTLSRVKLKESINVSRGCLFSHHTQHSAEKLPVAAFPSGRRTSRTLLINVFCHETEIQARGSKDVANSRLWLNSASARGRVATGACFAFGLKNYRVATEPRRGWSKEKWTKRRKVRGYPISLNSFFLTDSHWTSKTAWWWSWWLIGSMTHSLATTFTAPKNGSNSLVSNGKSNG